MSSLQNKVRKVRAYKPLTGLCERAGGLGRFVAIGFLLVAGALGGPFALAEDDVDLIDAEGIVQEISMGQSTVIISGFEYRVVPHADVQIRGNASSIAALVVGMKVSFLYEHFEGFKAEMSAVNEGYVIHQLEQLPDSVVVQVH